MEIAPASLEDCRHVAQVHVDAWRAAYAGILSDEFLASLSVDQREAMWRETIARGSPIVLAAKIAEELKGWVAFGSAREDGAPAARGEVWAIYVAPSAWSSGVGKCLMQAAMETLNRSGYREASVWVMADNARARSFYAGIGMRLENESEKFFELGGHRIREVRYYAPLPLQL